MKQSILELAAANPGGLTNADAVLTLGLQSDHNGEQRNFLSWSLLGTLMREGSSRKVGRAGSARYKHVQVGQVLA